MPAAPAGAAVRRGQRQAHKHMNSQSISNTEAAARPSLAGHCRPSGRIATRARLPAAMTTRTRARPRRQVLHEAAPTASSRSPVASAAAVGNARAGGAARLPQPPPSCQSWRRARRTSNGNGASAASVRCGSIPVEASQLFGSSCPVDDGLDASLDHWCLFIAFLAALSLPPLLFPR